MRGSPSQGDHGMCRGVAAVGCQGVWSVPRLMRVCVFSLQGEDGPRGPVGEKGDMGQMGENVRCLHKWRPNRLCLTQLLVGRANGMFSRHTTMYLNTNACLSLAYVNIPLYEQCQYKWLCVVKLAYVHTCNTCVSISLVHTTLMSTA